MSLPRVERRSLVRSNTRKLQALSFSVGVTQRMKPSPSGSLQYLDFAVELAGNRIFRDLQVVVRLQVHPELRLHAEELPEPQGGIRRDSALALHDLVDAPRRHADALGKALPAEVLAFEEILGEHHAGVHRIEFAFGHVALLQG